MPGGAPQSAEWWLRTQRSGVSARLVVMLRTDLDCSHVACRLIGVPLPRSGAGGPYREKPVDPDSGRRTDQPVRGGGAADLAAPRRPADDPLFGGVAGPRAAHINAAGRANNLCSLSRATHQHAV